MRKPIKHGKVKNRLLMPNMLTALLIVSKKSDTAASDAAATDAATTDTTTAN